MWTVRKGGMMMVVERLVIVHPLAQIRDKENEEDNEDEKQRKGEK
jgi:hypothetical protein